MTIHIFLQICVKFWDESEVSRGETKFDAQTDRNQHHEKEFTSRIDQ
jgi:hypothetical protein